MRRYKPMTIRIPWKDIWEAQFKPPGYYWNRAILEHIKQLTRDAENEKTT